MLPLVTLLATALFGPPTTEFAAASTDDYHATIGSVVDLNQKMNLGESVEPQLRDALARLPDFTRMLAADPDARTQRARAQLNLARSYLSQGDQASAAGVMDEVIRSTAGDYLPIDEMGPSLVKLHAERVAVLEAMGTGTIVVKCAVPCRAYIDERIADTHNEGLYLGVYRVWVESADGQSGLTPVIRRIELDEAGEPVFIHFPKPTEKPEQLPEVQLQRRPSRIMPDGVEAGMIAVGVALLTVGATMVGIDHNETQTIVGGVLTGLGASSLLVGGITLSVDEVRVGDQRGRQAMISWRVRF